MGGMHIVFATAELSPIATVGGLAAAAAGLVRELRAQGHRVDLLLPDYAGVSLAHEKVINLDVPSWAGPARIRHGLHEIVGDLHLVSVPGIERGHPYLQPDGEGWPDNTERFLGFSRAIAAYVQSVRPDVVHLNDWHTATALAALDGSIPSVLSLHNLAYQGTTSADWIPKIGTRGSHYEWWGGLNPLTGAIALADRIIAVSPNYSTEIRTPEGGFGIHEALGFRGDAVIGVLNGIDTDIWDPSADPLLESHFSATRLDGREPNRRALRSRLGFPDDLIPLATVVTRLTEQKGIDLLLPIIPLLAQVPMRMAVLGSGDAALSAQLHQAAATYPDDFAFVEGYDEALSHQMFAGADVFVMPSRFEPCGLTQMQAMRYGSIPVVTAVGGLVDTVIDLDLDSRRGTGVVASAVEPAALTAAIFRLARRITDSRRRERIQRRIMSIDWSWSGPAQKYVTIYRDLVSPE
jgi:starch synthase